MNHSKDPIKSYVEHLLATNDDQLKKLNDIVLQSIKEEKLLSHKLHKENIIKATWSEKISDKMASFGGSWNFIIVFILLVISWILINQILPFKPFDPYPYILLNLFLSLIAALQAPIILMSQNRQEKRDRKRLEHDYLINLKAELEIRSLHQKMDLMLLEQMKTLIESQAEQIALLQNLSKK